MRWIVTSLSPSRPGFGAHSVSKASFGKLFQQHQAKFQAKWRNSVYLIMHLYRIVQLNAFQICQLDGYRFNTAMSFFCQSQWPRGLRLRSAAACLLRSWVRIPPGAWIFVCCECRVLSGRGLCDELITGPEESYRLWCVVVCDLETSRMRRS